MSAVRDRGDDFVTRLVELLRQCAGGFEEQLAAQTVEQLAKRFEETVREEEGGQPVYIHRVGWFNRSERDEAIRADARSGRSIRWIANRYCLSKSVVHEIVKADPAAG